MYYFLIILKTQYITYFIFYEKHIFMNSKYTVVTDAVTFIHFSILENLSLTNVYSYTLSIITFLFWRKAFYHVL